MLWNLFMLRNFKLFLKLALLKICAYGSFPWTIDTNQANIIPPTSLALIYCIYHLFCMIKWEIVDDNKVLLFQPSFFLCCILFMCRRLVFICYDAIYLVNILLTCYYTLFSHATYVYTSNVLFVIFIGVNIHMLYIYIYIYCL